MPQRPNQVEHICQQCQQPFTAKASRGKVRYCGQTCRNIARATTKAQAHCPVCGTEFTYYRKYPQTYCSISCGITARNLSDKNPSYSRDISGEKNPMYGKGLFGPDNPMYGKTRAQNPAWNGGRKVRKDGYVLVIAPSDHPYPISSRKVGGTRYILEHRHVMEQHLGRFLEPNEVIHHIDGDPCNNDITNLRLYSSQSAHISDAHGG